MDSMDDTLMYDEPFEPYTPRIRYKTCRYCGLGGLHWETPVTGKWRLYNSLGDLHECNQRLSNTCRCVSCRGCNLQSRKR